MTDERATSGRKHRAARPIDAARLEELALAYAARFATTAAKLESYLKRKLRERGYVEEQGGEGEPDVAGVVARCVAHGYVDDAIYGRARASGLLARGYGARRVESALRGAGVGESLRARCAPGEAAARAAALRMARKRGFGPFGERCDEPPEAAHKRREKQLAAMLRAGHDFAAARTVIDAAAIEELERWVDEAQDDLPE